MKILNVQMQTQKDKDCKYEVMTFPKWQENTNMGKDLIIEYGCYITTHVNAYNLFNVEEKYYTIKKANQLMRDNLGYYYIYYLDKFNGDLEKTKEMCFQKESYARQDVLNDILEIKEFKKDYYGEIEIEHPNYFYMIKTEYQRYGHYSLIVKSDLSYFDSYKGKIITPKKREALRISRIEF